MATGGGEFRLNNGMATTALGEELKVMETLWNVGFEEERGTVGQEMYLAKGLGIGGSGGGRGGRGGGRGRGGEFYSAGYGGDSQGVEEYYKKMVEENPGNPLFLSNYAQFLYQSKQDLPKAEEYYSRAILADPGDGEILSQYAKLVWELHNDQDRAATYHERAVHASPEDSHVHASYAGFLWETEEDNDECDAPSELDPDTPQIRHAAVASATATA